MDSSPKIYVLPLFTHPYVVPNLNDLLSSIFFHALAVTCDQSFAKFQKDTTKAPQNCNMLV